MDRINDFEWVQIWWADSIHWFSKWIDTGLRLDKVIAELQYLIRISCLCRLKRDAVLKHYAFLSLVRSHVYSIFQNSVLSDLVVKSVLLHLEPTVCFMCSLSFSSLFSSWQTLFFFFLQSNLIDSQSSSLSALNTSEDEYLEDNILDSSFASSQLDQSLHQGNWKYYSIEGMWIFISHYEQNTLLVSLS